MNGDAVVRRMWGDELERVITPVASEALAELAGQRDTLRAHLGQCEWDELGAPANDSATMSVEWVETIAWREARVLPQPVTFRQFLTGPIAAVERRRDRDEAVAETTGFRLSAGIRSHPWTGLQPADVCTLRLIASEGQHKIVTGTLVQALRDRRPDEALTLAMIKLGEEDWLLEAVAYQLPGHLGVELLTSEPPEPELVRRIRLPYRAVLIFFDHIRLDVLTAAHFDENLVLDSDEARVDPGVRGIIGVVLAGGDDGRLQPWVQWLLGEHVIGRGWSVGSSVGIWQHSAFAGAVLNLAAICTWGDWRPPPPAPSQVDGPEGTRTWRRSLQRSGARKAIARGALTGVHVLDVTATSPTEPGEQSTGASTGRHVRTHWRAGHWQNYRLATRDAGGAIIGAIRGERDVDREIGLGESAARVQSGTRGGVMGDGRDVPKAMEEGLEPVVAEEGVDRPPEEGIGLCLSGGGYRAMSFHLGAVIRLNELGVLSKLARVSSVSGGSITAGMLGCVWKDLTFTNGVATNLAEHLVVPIRQMAEVTIDRSSILSGVLRPGRTIADSVVRAYDKHLFQGANISDLPTDDVGPRFVINATNVQTGKLFRMSRPYLADHSVGRWLEPRLSLADAVCASSAFPPFLSPHTIKPVGNHFEPAANGANSDVIFRDRVWLSDGGVYDNLGLETVWKRYRTVLVSDGGGLLESEKEPKRNWAQHGIRVANIADGQVRALRRKQAVSSYTLGLRSGTYWGLRSDQSKYPVSGPFAIDPLAVRRARTVSTRLARLDDLTQAALINWGYVIADTAMRGWVVKDAPPPTKLPA